MRRLGTLIMAVSIAALLAPIASAQEEEAQVTLRIGLT
jgi:hypothetical protein